MLNLTTTTTNFIKAEKLNYLSNIKDARVNEYKYELDKHNQKLEYISINAEQKTPDKLASKMLKACITKRQGMHPKIFCRRWFKLEVLKENGQPRYQEKQIIAMESEYGYREKCINLIARLLKIKPNTVQRWGKGVEFDKIAPDKRIQYEMYLGYIDTIRVMTTSFAELDEALLIRVACNLSVKEFL
jgi:hypothetical protein